MMNDKPMTATEILAMREAYQPVLDAHNARWGAIVDRIGKRYSKTTMKILLKTMTNRGPVLELVEPFTIRFLK